MSDSQNDQSKFQPILLGSDFNVYGMARAFNEAYGIKSIAYGSAQLAPTKYSQIVHVNVIEGFHSDPVFIESMREIAKELKPGVKYLLIACGDGYAELVSKHKDELSESFICPYVDSKPLVRSQNTGGSGCRRAEPLPAPQVDGVGVSAEGC